MIRCAYDFLAMLANLSKLSRRSRRLHNEDYLPAILPANMLVEEELQSGCDVKSFLAIHPGDVLSNRYEATAKLGCGSASTVWLARDLHQYVQSSP